MPMQRIETIDEPRSEAAASGQLSVFERQNPRVDDFRNRLIWGDNKLVMSSLLREFKGAVNLIYIDPPFFTGTDQKISIQLSDGRTSIEKDRSIIEEVAYRNVWGMGASSFCHWMNEILTLMKELLHDEGMIFIRFDQYWSHYVKVIADGVFSKDLFQNEIVVNRIHKNVTTQGQVSIPLATDTVLLYFRSGRSRFHEIKSRLSETRKGYWRSMNDSSGVRNPPERTMFGHVLHPPAGKHFKFSQAKIDAMIAAGKARLHPKTGRPQYWVEDSDEAIIDSNWTDIPGYSFTTGYPTENSQVLLERIIRAGSREGDLVADFFSGSGTTAAVAEQLGRRWVGVDIGRFSIHTTRKRLIETQRELHAAGRPYRAFDVYNLGRYERQWWQRELLQGADEEHRRVVLEFFRAELLAGTPSPLLHGRKGGAYCHVDSIDSIFSRDEARAVALATAAAGGKECYCLAWEFEMDLRLSLEGLEKEHGIKLKLIQIPREIMEKNRKNPPPFLEMARLEAEAVVRGKGSSRTVDVKLTRFLPSLAEVPSSEIETLNERALASGFDFIDFWAVDFDWQVGKPFSHHWQDYRTRKDRSLKTVSEAQHVYAKTGEHTICVKVVDIFGADTSITIPLKL